MRAADIAPACGRLPTLVRDFALDAPPLCATAKESYNLRMVEVAATYQHWRGGCTSKRAALQCGGGSETDLFLVGPILGFIRACE